MEVTTCGNQNCGRPIEQPATGRRKIYCRRTCRQRAYEDRKFHMPALHKELSKVYDSCYLCSKKLDWDSPDSIHFDHVIPTARGGLTNLKNIRPTHVLCNLSKATRNVRPDLFGSQTGYYGIVLGMNSVETLGL